MDSQVRVVGRRLAVVLVVALQLGFVIRGYSSDHKEFAFQMFSESSTLRAEIVRVMADGRRVAIEEPWFGYDWNNLVGPEGLRNPHAIRHAGSGLDAQLAFLDSSLDWVADHTPRDTETRYIEATVTYWYNTHGPKVVTLRSHERSGSS